MSEEIRKLQTHLSLLREEYVKLQRRLVDVEKQHQLATAGRQDCDNADGFVSRLLKIVSNLYGKELYSDLTIKLNGKEMKGHKFVLAARSDHWGSSDLSQVSMLDFSDIPLDVGLAVLKWVYTDQSESIHSADDSFVLSLLTVARKYKLDPLASRCEQALIVSINVRNCIKYYQTAEEIGANSLRNHCSQLISSHWNDFTSSDFTDMPASLAYSMFKTKTSYPLHAAIKVRREDVVFLYLVEHDLQLPAKLNEADDNDNLPLDLALQGGLEGIAQTLVKYKVDVNMADRNQWRLIHKAIKRGDEYASRFLIENGADVNALLPSSSQTPLHLAALFSITPTDSDMADSVSRVSQLLLQHGASANAQDSSLRTPLHCAIETGNIAVFNVLLSDGGCDLELPDRDGFTALWLALIKSSSDVENNVFACQLVSRGSSTNAVVTKAGETMLHLAAQCSNESAGIFLISHGANSNAINNMGETALHMACQHGLIRLVKALLSAGANANVQTLIANDGCSTFRQTPMHVAVMAGHKDVVKALLDFKVEVTHRGHSLQVIPNLTVKDSDGHSALGLSLLRGNQLDICELLLTGGANVNDVDTEGRTLLFQAIMRYDEESAIFLLKHQADPNACAQDGADCLHAAVENRLASVVDMLCQKGAVIDKLDASGESVVWHALCTEQFDIADTLVRHGCDINLWSIGPGGCHQTLLHRAIDENKEDIACFLIQRKCDVNSSRCPGPSGDTSEEARDKQSPLHLSAAWGLEKIIQRLIEHNADVNAKDFESKTPLHVAIENQHYTIISLLLSHPALNLNTRDRLGFTPFAAAMAIKNNKAAQAILDREPTAAEQFDVKGRNFLHTAIQKSDLEAVLFLLSIHVDVNSRVRDSSQLTPLHLAVMVGHEMIARNLLLAGARINDTTPQKQSALHLAAAHDRASICIILLDSGINFDAVDENSNNALHVAVQNGHLNTVKSLLKHSSINAEAINMRGQNVLHILGQCGKENAAAILDFLLECRSNFPIDQLDANGNTVLLLGYFNGNGSLCRAVVKAGGQLGTVNRDGLSIFNAPVATKQLLSKLLDMLVKEPAWFEGETCLECSVRFGITTRKHHCRHCGRILCAKCSEKDIPIIKYNITKPVRVCDICFDVLTLGSTS